MKKGKFFYVLSYALPFLDYSFLILSFVIAYKIRLSEPYVFFLEFGEFVKFALIFSFFSLVGLLLSGLYALKSFTKVLEVFLKVVLGIFFGIALSTVFLFGTQVSFFSRKIMLYSTLLMVSFVFLLRLVHLAIEKTLSLLGTLQEKIILISKNKESKNLSEFLKLVAEKRKNELHVCCVIFLEEKEEKEVATLKLNSHEFPVLFGEEKIDEAISKFPSDTILVLDNFSDEKMASLLRRAELSKLSFKYFLSPFAIKSAGRTEVSTLDGIPIAYIKPTPLEGWGKILKRAFDIVFSVFLLIFLSPLFLIVAILIKLSSEGEVFFKHERVGYDGKKFTVYKFRTMVKDAEKLKEKLLKERGEEGLFKVKDDPRITKIGKFLRRTSIDELPQLWNVLKGEMSIVGPRPFVPEEEKKFPSLKYKRRFVKPGLTGLWQVSGRSNLNVEDLIKLDTYYVENWSFLLDIQILFKTIFVVIKKEGAY